MTLRPQTPLSASLGTKLTWLRTTGLAIVSAPFFHGCSPVSILAPQLEKAHTTSPRTHNNTIQDSLPSPSSHGCTVFLFSFQLWEFVFSHSPKPELRLAIRKWLALPVSAGAVRRHKVDSALVQVELSLWPLLGRNDVYNFYCKNFEVGSIFPHFSFSFPADGKTSHFLFPPPVLVSVGTI